MTDSGYALRFLFIAGIATAFKQAIDMLWRGGACVLNGLPPGEFPISIFDVVLSRYTRRGSIVDTRLDMKEALAFAAEGKIKATLDTHPLESIKQIFGRLKAGHVNGLVVLAIVIMPAHKTVPGKRGHNPGEVFVSDSGATHVSRHASSADCYTAGIPYAVSKNPKTNSRKLTKSSDDEWYEKSSFEW